MTRPSIAPSSRVSIVVPAYNYERYIARAIESALAQDYQPIDVLVVNDGSTDQTGIIAASFESQGVRLINQPNQGLAAARNTGIANTTSDLLLFLDADDFLEPHAVSTLMSEFDQRDASWGLVACQAKVLLQDGSLFSPDSGPQQSVEVTWTDLMFGSRFPCCVLIRRTVFEQCGPFDAAYHHLGCEDRDMWLRTAERFRLWSIPDKLVVVAFHGANMSSNPNRQLAGIHRCLTKALASQNKPRQNLPFRLKVWAVFHTNATLLHSQAWHHARAAWHAFLSLLLWPLPGLSRLAGRPSGFRARRLAIALRDGFHLQPKSSS
jgi:glycosyltransferase involved in cell wall biosynthesis